MLKGVWGKKIGMTQVFTENNKVVPVTVVDTSNWIVTQIKTKARDGYQAAQVGWVRPKFQGTEFTEAWLKDLKQYFCALNEIEIEGELEGLHVGQPLNCSQYLQEGILVNAVGHTRGRGFQGVVKRYNFAGGPKSHGSKLGRVPGSRGFTRSSGEVSKGKKTPGHMGLEQRTIQKLSVVRIDGEANLVLVKGSVPGGAGATVYLRKV
jgi:large subunit ribosomal protein L3